MLARGKAAKLGVVLQAEDGFAGRGVVLQAVCFEVVN